MILPSSQPFPPQWSHSAILRAKNLSSSFKVTHESAGGRSHVQLPTTSDSDKHMRRSTALKRQTGIRFFFLLHYYFTFLPLSALTCLSCDGTQAFFRNRWHSDGLGEPDHLISYLLLLLLKSPPAFTFHLCSTRCLRLYRLTISLLWPVTIYGADVLKRFKLPEVHWTPLVLLQHVTSGIGGSVGATTLKGVSSL